MAEAVAFGASVVAFIQLADRVVSLAKRYIEALQDAPATIRAIFVQISALRAIFDSLKFLERYQDQASLGIIRQLAVSGGVIDLCRDAVADLAELLPGDEDADISTGMKRKRAQAADLMTRLAWPFKEERARKKLEEIGRYSQSITLAVSTETIQEMHQVKQTVEEMSNSLSADRRHAIHKWLESTDPSGIHQTTLSLHKDQTSDWVLRTTEWAAWLAGQSRCLWIRGIPGSGKSVLAAYLIQQIENHCNQHSRYASVFYYCYFGNNQDESNHLLRWLISQLCRQSECVPNGLVHIYNTGRQRGQMALLTILEAVLQPFDKVFLSIDALDESNPRQPVLDLVRTLVTDPRFSKIHLLTTSREYLQIEEVMTPIAVQLPMDHELVREDIRVYVRSVMETGRDFKRLAAGLKEHIEQKLTCGAKGMFRWAVCQLDILRRLKTARQINAALDELPETLDDTYERILSVIPREHAQLVRKTLLLLCSGAKFPGELGPIYSSVLLTVLLTTEEGYLDDPYENPYDTDALRDICGCLIRVTPGTIETVEMAHYTVAEYILSSRCGASTAQAVSFYSISPSELVLQYGQLILQVGTAYGQLRDRLGNNPEMNKAELTWPCLYFLRFLSSREPEDWTTSEERGLLPLIWEFITHNDLWDVWYREVQRSIAPYREHRKDLHIFLKLFTANFPGLAIRFLEQSNQLRFLLGFNVRCDIHAVSVRCCLHLSCTVIHSRLLQLMDPTSFLMLSLHLHYHGFKCDLGNTKGDPNSSARYEWDPNCSINVALNRGADPNCLLYGRTPLQLAVNNFDEHAVLLLLKHGADANLVTTRDGSRQGYDFSPLRLCRQGTCAFVSRNSPCGDGKLCDVIHSGRCSLKEVPGIQSLRGNIERMLVERGARDFLISPEGVETSTSE
ncbi:hypothetical protein GE09DRAFT_313769 [Coniochaeta sp. 2T2.1]|nr:hypothetical protein GE09DRAFT_313769 [Coniochaeta sp. 2T2.1]